MQDIVVFHRVVVVRTPLYRVGTFYDEVLFFKPGVLPFYEFFVGRVSCCELAPPVNGVPYHAHGFLSFHLEIVHNLFRSIEGRQDISGDPVQALIYVHGLRVPACDQFGKPDNRCACYMEAHGVKHIVPEHPFVPCNHVAYCEGAGMPCMQVPVKIRVRDCYEELFPLIRFSLKNPALIPFFLPFVLDLVRLIVLLH